MKKSIFAGVLIFLCAAQLWAAPALKVLAASPKGQQNDMGRQAINVHFNQPVVKLGEETAFSSKNCPLDIVPKVEGSCRLSGTQTLLFEPAKPWPAATRFTVTVPQGFKSTVSGENLSAAYQFSFNTQVPRVTQVYPYPNEHWVNLNPSIYVATTPAVDLVKAVRYISLADGKGGAVPVSVRPLTAPEIEKNFAYFSAEEKKNLFAINPSRTLQVGQKYTLTLKAGLPAKTGTLGMAQKYETAFYTYPSLRVEKVISTGCLAFTPEILFSSPVRKREVYNFLEVTPSSAKKSLPDTEKESLGYEFVNSKTGEAYFRMPLSFLDVQPQQTIKVTLKKGLQDIYGNTLAKDEIFTISNTGYCPSVDFSADGIGVLESYLPARLPIALMNIPSLFVEAARFNRDNFIPFYNKNASYCARKELTDAAFAGDYAFADIKDKTYRTFIDLNRFKPTAKDSIIFTQFKTKRDGGQRDCWTSSTDNITDVGVTFKTSPDSILLWTTSLKTGQPLAGLSVELRSQENKIVWTGTSDANGIVRAPGWGKLEVPTKKWGQPALYAFVTSPNGDSVVSNLWNDGMEPWRFNMDYDYNPTAQSLQAYVFTERGVYRPGETVHIKGVLRQQKDGAWRLPEIVRGTFTISDARGEEFSKKDVTISSRWGSFDTELELPSSAAAGYWDVSFVPQLKGKDPQEASASFQVEAVKPADFNVVFKADKSSYASGETAMFSTSAQYYFGAPLSGAKAQWTLRQESAWFRPKGYEEYTFTPYFVRQELNNEEDGKILLQSSGELDARGSLSFKASMPRLSLPVNVYAEMDIASPAHQNLFKRTSVLVHPSDVYMGAKVLKDSHEQGKPVDIKLIAITPDGKPTQIEANAEIYREQYFSVRKVGLAGRLEWVSEKKKTPVSTHQVTIGKKGTTLSFVPQEGGSYFIKLTAKDSQGRLIVGGSDVYVYGKGNSYNQRTDDDLLTLKQNKNEYKVGQTARIRVQSPYEKAQALITVEREGILDAWTTTLTGPTADIKVPIKETYLPNVYVGVMLVQGRTAKPANYETDLGKPQAKIGYVNLNVVPESKRLVTTLKPNAKKYQPREKVSVDITTKAEGKGVPAEVVVMAVDEGILALNNYQTPDLFDFFYGSKPISVFTMDNRSYVIGQRSFGEKGENRGGGGAANSKLAGTDLRSRFLFTPYFAAAVHTDAKGKAQVSFELPDNLTTFRLMAVSLTADEFGKAEDKITVSKPVMLTPNVPTFARENDQFTCGAIVYNFEDSKGVFDVQVAANGSVQADGADRQTVNIPKGKSREVSWKCRAAKLGEGTVNFAVKGRYSDGVQTKVTVFTAEKEQTLAVYGSTQTKQKEGVVKPASLNLSADNRVSVSLASTALLQLKGALRYLLNYPYNCLEQQMSNLTAAVGASSLVKDFGLGDEKELRQQAQEIIKAVPSYQHVSGGYGYWPNTLPDPYVTAYALDMMLLSKQAGLEVPTQSIDKAVSWLQGAFKQNVSHAYTYSLRETDTTRAYSAYVLARYGKNTDSLFNTLYAKRTSLPQTAVAYLLQAAHAVGRSQEIQRNLAQQLTNKLVYTPTAAYIDEGVPMPWLHSNNVNATAHTLSALVSAKLPLDNDFQLAKWLLSQVNAQGYWHDTNTSAAVLRALQDYYAAHEAQTPNFTATVKQGGETLLSSSFQGRSLQEETVSVPFAKIYQNGKEAMLDFTKEGTGTLYYNLAQYYTPGAYTSPVDAGFKITRTISTLEGKSATEIVTGERYKVTLHIQNAATRSFVVAQDFIPAGFRLVNTSLATESAAQAELLQADNVHFNRIEQYDDRVYGFADELPAGKHTFSYLVTAISAGTYTYPAAWASQMYDPAVFGRNTTSTLVIK
ncbi:MAG: Ig-like domain-containing protein [Elusimicrobiaceae bacterium]|nr:Ig-like domain-containing protein [Elusimicrobiaceae bacterium]